MPAIILARLLALAVCAVLLGACSAARLAYNQAPSLAYWWIDGHVDLNDAQSVQVRQDIDEFFTWHRRTELPGYADLLGRWQPLVAGDISAAQACEQFEPLRTAYQRMTEHGLAPLARLARQLSPAQMEHLQTRQARDNAEFKKQFLRGSAEQRLARRLDQTTGRYERLYGTLSREQQALLKTGLARSPFDAQRTLAERLRHQEDLRQTLRQLQARQPPAAAAAQALRGWFDRGLQSPTPGHAAYTTQLVQHGCDLLATLHNSTTPAQRTHAARVLQGYEADLRSLIAQR